MIRQPSKPMNGSINAADIRAGLVIGIHKPELGFGLQVAAMLAGSGIRIVQIDQGLPQQGSFNGKGYYYGAFHREIYLQVHQQVKGKLDLLIDLHTGINETCRCADLFCADIHLLGRLKKILNVCKPDLSNRLPALRLFEIISDSTRERENAGSFPVCHTIIPPVVWDSAKYSYVGLEIYLQDTGKGNESDWAYGVGIVKSIIKAKSEII